MLVNVYNEARVLRLLVNVYHSSKAPSLVPPIRVNRSSIWQWSNCCNDRLAPCITVSRIYLRHLAFQLTMFKTTKDGVLGKPVETSIPSWFTPGFRNATAGMMRKVAMLMANKSTHHHVCSVLPHFPHYTKLSTPF